MPEDLMNATKIGSEKALSAVGFGENMPSPCVSVCRMEATGGLCEGCLRTLDEIAGWSAMTDAGKRAVWRLIGQRVAVRQETLK